MQFVVLVMDALVCLTPAKREIVSGQFGGYLMTSQTTQQRRGAADRCQLREAAEAGARTRAFDRRVMPVTDRRSGRSRLSEAICMMGVSVMQTLSIVAIVSGLAASAA